MTGKGLRPQDAALVEKVFGKPVMLDEEGEDWGALLDAARAEGATRLRDALLGEEAVEAAGEAAGQELIDQELSGAFDDLGEDGSNQAIAKAALSAALEKIGAPHVER